MNPDRSPNSSRNPRTRNLLLCLGLALLVLLTFGRTVRFGFVNFDDDALVSENPRITGGLSVEGIRWALTAGIFPTAPTKTGGEPFETDYWRPVSLLSHMLDVQLFGLRPGWHHAVNVVIHAAAAILLFLALLAMTNMVWRSALVAALFAVHPLHVESVAWVAERKDVLSGLFFMLSLLAYARYVRRPERPFAWGDYLAVLLSAALAMMSKPMVVTLPCVLLLLDYWPLGRTDRVSGRRLLLEKLPILILAATVAWITTRGAGGLNSGIMNSLSLPWRMGNALVSCALYLKQTFWPSGLAVFYPHPGKTLPPSEILLAAMVLLPITGLVVWKRENRYLTVGWLWFLGMLVPVIGIIQSGAQAAADRYTYLPLIGVFIMIVWAAAEWAGGGRWNRGRRLLTGWIAAVVLTVLAAVAFRQTGFWRESILLMRHAIACTGENPHARTNLAKAYEQAGRTQEALREYAEVVRLQPDFTYSHYNLATALERAGQPEEALREMGVAITLNPNLPDSEIVMGRILLQKKNPGEALPHFQKAARLDPRNAETHNLVGSVALMGGDSRQAIAEFEEAARLDSANGTYANNLAWILATSSDRSLRDGTRALALAERASRQLGEQPVILRTLAAARAASGDFRNAVNTATRAEQLALSSGNAALAESLRRDLSSYRQGKRPGD